MKLRSNLWEYAVGAGLLVILIFSLGVIVPRQRLAAQATQYSGDSAYPYPMETDGIPSPIATLTEIPLQALSTMTPVPITPYPTLTLRPGPSPTPIPLREPAQDAAGMIFFIAKESENAKSALHALGIDAAGKMTNLPAKVSEDEAQKDGFVFPSPAGNRLAITGPWGALSIYDLEKGAVEKDLSLGPEGIFLNWFPDSQQFLYRDGMGPLVLADLLSGDITILAVPGYGHVTAAAASPDGQYVVYAYSTNVIYPRGMWRINANGQNAHLFVKDVAPFHMAWSPDGKRIAFFEYGWQVVDADGSNLREIAPGVVLTQCFHLPPLWSPDSRSLAVVTSTSSQSFCPRWGDDNFKGTQIVLIDVESGKSRPLLSDGSTGNIDPAWSPDGSQIAFVSNRGGAPGIWVANVDGTNLHPLTEGYQLARFPVWRGSQP